METRKIMKINKAYEDQGYWWPAEEGEDERLPGFIEFHPDSGVKLELMGRWDSISLDDLEPREMHLHGITRGGKKITIPDASAYVSNLSMPGMFSTGVKAYEMFVGNHWEDGEPEYLALYAEFSNLKEWLNQRSVEIQHEDFTTGKATVKHELPEPIPIEVEGIDAVVEFQTTARLEPGRSSASIEGKGLVKIEPAIKKSWLWYRENLRKLKFYLALLTDSEVTEISIQGVRGRREVKEGKTVSEKDKVLRRPVLAKPAEEKHPFRMLFSRDKMDGWLEDGLQRWFEEWEVVKPLSTLHLAVAYRRDDMFADSQLLALMQGLEGYHRNVHGKGYITEEEWMPFREDLKKQIPAELGKSHRDSLKAALKYGFTYSQRRRMKDLLRELTPEERRFVCEDIESFRHEVVDARNTYVHRGGDVDEMPGLGDVADYNYRLRNLGVIHMLRFLGADPTEIARALERTGRVPVQEG